MTRAAMAALAAAVAVLSGCGGGDDGDGGGGSIGETLEIELREQNASGISGTAVLAPRGDKTSVVVEMIQAFDIDQQPAHIHKGTCDKLDPKPAYSLPNLEDGVGGDDVDVSLDELREGEYAINVHKSVKEADVYVACGEIS